MQWQSSRHDKAHRARRRRMASNHRHQPDRPYVLPSRRAKKDIRRRLYRKYLLHPRSHGFVLHPYCSETILKQTGFFGSGAYSTSKHGVIGLTRCAAKEVGDREIRVNAVAPGSIMTPLLLKAQEANPAEGNNMPTAIKRVGSAEEVAGLIAFLLGPDSSYSTGMVFGSDGGWNC
jgi:NAD(P)-dependent dehydrogenase (short-subunit alcohol dehydrogenase family)